MGDNIKGRAEKDIAYLQETINQLQVKLAKLDGTGKLRDQIISDAKTCFDHLKPFIGIRIKDGPDRGVLVFKVIDKTPGEFYGLKQGDIIEAMDNHDVNTNAEAMARLRKEKPGNTISLQVNRNGVLMNIQLVVGSRKLNNEELVRLRRHIEGIVSEDDYAYIKKHGVSMWARYIEESTSVI